MKIKVTNLITIEDPTQKILQYCKDNLVFDNPDYLKKQQMGFWVGNCPKYITLYSFENNKLEMPFGCLKTLCNNLWNVANDYLIDCGQVKINIQSKIKLREYQQCAVDAIEKYKNGVLVMFAGSGKTQTALDAIAKVGLKTLWLVNTGDLLKQAKQRAIDNLIDCKVSEISEGKCDISGDVVFATVQTLVKYCDNALLARKEFGIIIVDECQFVAKHADSLGMFETCINYFSCRYKIGLTATLHRATGLERAILALIGDVIYSMDKNIKENVFDCKSFGVTKCAVPIAQFQVPAKVVSVDTDYNLQNRDYLFDADGGVINYTKLITDIGTDFERNNLIRKYIDAENNNYCLVLSDRIEHLKLLAKDVPNSVVLQGNVKKDIISEVFDNVRRGKTHYIFASYKLAGTGLDIPRLDRLFLATPVKDFAIVVQSIGRIQRPFTCSDFVKKECIVYDFVDKDVSLLSQMYKKRKKIYKQQGVSFE